MMVRLILVLLVVLSGVFGYLFYVQYYKWRGCFDDLGRCFDARTGVVYFEQSGIVWFLLTALTFAVAVFWAWRLRKS